MALWLQQGYNNTSLSINWQCTLKIQTRTPWLSMGKQSLKWGQLSTKYFQIIPPFTGIQECGLVVNEVVENLELSDSKLNGDKKHYVILPISPGLGGQSYLILVAGERFEVSRGISQGVRKLSRTPWS